MAQFPAFPLWTDAYLGDTTHLTTIEHGAYLLLLIVAWRSKDGCLPDNDILLARYTKLNKGQWKKVRVILEPFFNIENGKWIQGRLIDELNAVKQLSQSQSRKAKARWLKNNDSNNAAASSGHSPIDASPTPPPTPTQIDKPPYPQERKKEGLKNSFSGVGYNIDLYLNDTGRAFAKMNAQGWDMYGLIEIYNEGVRNGKREPPKNPNTAFPAWCAKYTKNKQL